MDRVRRGVAVVLAAGMLACSGPALSADAPAPSAHSLALAQRLFAGFNMNTMMDGMMRSVTPAMLAQARKNNPNLSAADAQVISDAVADSSREMMGKVMERMIPLYASTFSEKELEDAVAFYEGPSGKAMLSKMHTQMAKMGPVMADLMPQMSADVNRRVCAKIDCSRSEEDT